MRKLISALLALTLTLSVCACSLAEGDAVTLAELKAQAPERLQMTVTTDAGNTPTGSGAAAATGATAPGATDATGCVATRDACAAAAADFSRRRFSKMVATTMPRPIHAVSAQISRPSHGTQ